MNAPTLRIFVSAEEAVRHERDNAVAVVNGLKTDFSGQLTIELILVDDLSPDRLAEARRSGIAGDLPDIVISLMSSRLGPSRPRHPHEGDGGDGGPDTSLTSRTVTQSHFETPQLLVYRRVGNGIAIRSEVSASLKHKKAFNEFMDDWFGGAADHFEAAFRAYSSFDELEKMMRTDLTRIITKALSGDRSERDEAGGLATWTRGSPFAGFDPFGADRSEVYFGRRRAIADTTKLLLDRAAAGCPLILISGMSGCGKTSLVDAGIIPAVTEPGAVTGIDVWRSCRFRPSAAAGGDLFAGLAATLLDRKGLPEMAEGGVTVDELADLLREAPRRADIPLRMALGRAGNGHQRPGDGPSTARLVLVVDQLEELFTAPDISSEDRRRFSAALYAMASSGQVWILATLRSDYRPDCAGLPEIAGLINDGGEYHLKPPTFAELGQIIRGPVRAAGLQFETNPETGERLDDMLHQAAIADEGSLPLLEYVMQELHHRIRTGDRLLTFNAYNRLGGFDGLVTDRCESVFGGLDRSLQAALPALLRALVTVSVEDDSEAMPRTALKSDICVTPQRSQLLDAFIDARLIIADLDDQDRPVVRIACSGVLRRWQRVRDWMEEDRRFLGARATLTNSARYWQQRKRHPDFLISEWQTLAEHEILPEEGREYLDEDAIEYVEASIAASAERRRRQSEEENRRSRRMTWIVAVLVGVIAAASAIGGYMSYFVYLRIGS